MIGLNHTSQFISSPKLKANESLRSLLSRLLSDNLLPLDQAKDLFHIRDATKQVMSVHHMAGWNLEKVLSRGGYFSSDVGQVNNVVRIGQANIGRKHLVGSRRKICPLCAARPQTPLYWELRLTPSCAIHEVKLIDKCTRCQTPIPWFTNERRCRCNLKWSRMEKTKAQPWEVILSRELFSAVRWSIINYQVKVHRKQRYPLRIEKTLLMLDVFRHVFLSRWLSPELWRKHNMELAVHMLLDKDYASWTWQKIFMNAAQDPMTLARALLPTGVINDVAGWHANLYRNQLISENLISRLQELGCSAPPRAKIFSVKVHGPNGIRQLAAEWDLATRSQDDAGRPKRKSKKKKRPTTLWAKVRRADL